MDFFIKNKEPLQPGLRRIEMELLEHVEQHLKNHEKVHDAIHNARRGFKKLRALSRLLRFNVGQKAYRNANQFYRNEARKISLIRDTTAMIEAVDRLAEKANDAVSEQSLCTLKLHLQERRTTLLKEEEQIVLLLDQIYDQMDVAWKKMLLVDNHKIKLKDLLKGVEKVYTRAHSGFYKCREQASDIYVHEWRKRAKYLRYQLSILQLAWIPVFKALEEELHQLTDYLGDFHDLEVLKDTLNKLEFPLESAVKETLIQLIGKQQTAAYELALGSGSRLFAEKPKAFVRRLKSYMVATWGKSGYF